MDKKKFSIAICDDEQMMLNEMQSMVVAILEAAEVEYETACFLSCQELLETLNKNEIKFHLLLLDIIMDGMDGIKLAEIMKKENKQVMIAFFSCSMDYVLRGYEVNAIRYLTKPIEYERLKETLFTCYENSIKKKEIMIHSKMGMGRIALENIYYIEVQGRGTIIYLKNGILETATKISEFEKELTMFGFLRCHQGFLVNIYYIEGAKRYELNLRSGIKLPIGKLRYNDVRQKLLEYLAQ